MKKTEKILLGLILITNITFGVYVYYSIEGRIEGISAIMMVNYLAMITLPAYYLVGSKFSHFAISMLCFILLPLGMLFKMQHWPSGTVLFMIGIFGYFSSGVQLLLEKSKLQMTTVSRIAIMALAISSIAVVLKVFVTQIVGYIDIERFLQLIIMISALFLLVSERHKISATQAKLTTVLFMHSFLPLCFWVVALLR